MSRAADSGGSVIPHSKPAWGEAEVEALVACARSLELESGRVTAALEAEIAADLGFAGAVATPTASFGILLALKARFPHGARVGCPSYVCRSVYDAIVAAGAEPCLLDVEPATWSVALDATVAAGVDAVVVAHLFGVRAPVERFVGLGVFVIEDCAQRIAPPPIACGEPRGAVRVLSFAATKLLTCGQGGLLLTDDRELLARVRRLRDAPYDSPQPAIGFAPTDLQAAVALEQWRRLPAFLRRRRELAERYVAGGLWSEPAMRRPDTYHFRFVAAVRQPDAFIARAARHGVTVRRPVAPLCLHRLLDAPGDFGASEHAVETLISLPLYPALTDDEATRVIDAALDAQAAARRATA